MTERQLFYLEKEKEVIYLYTKGMSCKEIQVKTGISLTFIAKQVKKHAINRGSGKKSTIPLNLFTNETANGNYWLGYLAADGNIQETPRSSCVKFLTKDYEMVEKFLKYTDNKVNIFIPKDNTEYTLVYFGSKEIVKYLISIGITPKKSNTLYMNIPITKDFVRGVIDGDGSVHNKKSTIKITSGSVKFLEQIKEFLNNNDIKSSIRKRNQDKNSNNCYDLWIETNEGYCKLFELLYKDAEFYMNRKYNRWVAIYRNIDRKWDKLLEG